MKDDIQVIMSYLNCKGETSRLRSWLLSLDASRPSELRRAVDELSDSIKQINIQSHEHAGHYYLFLGCVYYELDNYERAVTSLQSAISEMWGEQLNKSLARWLLGLCHFNMQDFPRARRELEEALQLLATTLHANYSPHGTERPAESPQRAIEKTLASLLNQPLFRSVRPDPVQSTDRFPLQDAAASEGDMLHISVTNENYPVNKILFKLPKTESTSEHEHQSIERAYENRTDDGYLVIQSIPVYEGYARAGQSDAPEPSNNNDNFAEFHHVTLDGELHTIHSLRSKSQQVNVNKENNWGWIKIKGKSMNAIHGNISINEGDYVLFKDNRDADDNDIVIAVQKDEFSTHVKRYKKSEKMLCSETSEEGPEYEPIDIRSSNMQIAGIVHAVAKPINS